MSFSAFVGFANQDIADRVLRTELLNPDLKIENISKGTSENTTKDVVFLKIEGLGISELRITRLESNIKAILFTMNLRPNITDSILKAELEKSFPDHVTKVSVEKVEREDREPYSKALIYCKDRIKAKTVLLQFKLEENITRLYIPNSNIDMMYSNTEEGARKIAKRSQYQQQINKQLPNYYPYPNQQMMMIMQGQGGLQPQGRVQQPDMSMIPIQYQPNQGLIMQQPPTGGPIMYEGYMHPNMGMVKYPPPAHQGPSEGLRQNQQMIHRPYQMNVPKQYPPSSQNYSTMNLLPLVNFPQQLPQQQLNPQQPQAYHQRPNNQIGSPQNPQGIQANLPGASNNQQQGGYGGPRGTSFDQRGGAPNNQGGYNYMGQGGMNQRKGQRDPKMPPGQKSGNNNLGQSQPPHMNHNPHQQRNIQGSMIRGVIIKIGKKIGKRMLNLYLGNRREIIA